MYGNANDDCQDEKIVNADSHDILRQVSYSTA